MDNTLIDLDENKQSSNTTDTINIPDSNKIENKESSTCADSTLDPITAIDMCDKFLVLYNAKHQVGGSLCESVNIKDPLSTNPKMETLNEYIVEHKYLLRLGRHYIDIYDSRSQLHNDINFNIYALISHGTIKYLSLSYMSLLSVGIKNDTLSKNWNIVTL
jgi:hypothetical protein